MHQPLVENEAPPGGSTQDDDQDLARVQINIKHNDNTYIVSDVQPGIYSGFTPSYGTVSEGGEAGRRGGTWARKQVFGVDENEERGNWTGRMDYLLSMLGYAVGLGNVWRFPYLCYSHGGGAFLVPYLVFMTFVGIPLFYLEASLGQFSSCGPSTCWEFAPLFQGVGVAMLVSSFMTSIYYCMVIAWCIFYFFASFTSSLPWSDCDGDWTTEYCSLRLPDVDCDSSLDQRYLNGTCFYNGTFSGLWNYSAFQNSTGQVRVAPTKEYWTNYVLGSSDGIQHTGRPQWRLVLSLLFSWVLVFLCLIKGIKSAGKVVYFTAIFPYVVLLILFFRGVTLDNAGEGIKYYITPDFTKLGDISIWKAAAIQIFYSMGPAWGGIVALSSYNRFHNNILRDSLIVSLGNCMTSVFGGFVIFSFVGHMAGQLHVSVDHVADSGPGLAFVIYPEAVRSLPAPTFWAIIFFFMLITLGIDSQFATVEALLTGLIDFFPSLRPHKTPSIFALCVGMFLLGLPLTTKSGIYWVTLLDFYAASWGVLMVGLTETIAITYVYGVNRFCSDIEAMIGPWSKLYWKMCWAFVTPGCIIFILLASWIEYKTVDYNLVTMSYRLVAKRMPATLRFILLASWIEYETVDYNGYLYPGWAEGLGWVISFIAVSTVPVIMAVKVSREKRGANIWQRIKILMVPTRKWGPALVKHRQLIKHVQGFVVNPEDENSVHYRNMSDHLTDIKNPGNETHA